MQPVADKIEGCDGNLPRRGAGVAINIQNAFSFSAESFGEMFNDPGEADKFYAISTEQFGATTQARDWFIGPGPSLP